MSGTSHGPGGDAAGDPSMEDILASIRRILSEDEVPAAPGAAGEHPTAGGAGGDDGVLVLDEAMMVEAPPHDAVPATPVSEVTHSGTAPADPVALPETAAPMVQPAPLPAATAGLMAPEAQAAAASSVGSLLRTLSTERSASVHRGGPTIEDLVREEIRPLLKTWLDQHLPPMVERLVRAEIERVTGRAEP